MQGYEKIKRQKEYFLAFNKFTIKNGGYAKYLNHDRRDRNTIIDSIGYKDVLE